MRVAYRRLSLTSSEVCCTTLDSMTHHEVYLVVILSVFVTVRYVTLRSYSNSALSASSVLRSIKMDENTVIIKVLDNPFPVRPLHHQLTRVENERPAAPLPNLMTVRITKSNTQNIFASLYIKRLTGWQDVKRRHLLFLSRHIFLKKREIWNKRGFL
jgi:hypothetical protein